MAREIILALMLFVLIDCLWGTRSRYKFERSEITNFVVEISAQSVQQQGLAHDRSCQICRWRSSELQQVCAEAVLACKDQFNYVLSSEPPHVVQNVYLQTKPGEVKEVVKCPTYPSLYLVNGHLPYGIKLIINGYVEPTRSHRLSGLAYSGEVFAYLKYLKERLKHASESSSRGGPSASQLFDKSQKERLKKHFKWFLEERKRRKAKKQQQQHGAVVAEEGQSSEEFEEFVAGMEEMGMPEVIPELPEPDLSGVDLGAWVEKIAGGIKQFFEEFKFELDD